MFVEQKTITYNLLNVVDFFFLTTSSMKIEWLEYVQQIKTHIFNVKRFSLTSCTTPANCNLFIRQPTVVDEPQQLCEYHWSFSIRKWYRDKKRKNYRIRLKSYK